MDNELIKAYTKLVSTDVIQPDQLQIKVLNSLSTYLNKPKFSLFTSKKNKKKGIYLYGDVGRGKSMLMNLYYENNHIVKKEKIHFNRFMQKIHGSLQELRNQNKKHPLKHLIKDDLSNLDLLYLDEIQVYDIGDAMIFYSFFSLLFAEDIIVMMTSNYSPEELYLDGIQRASFLPAIDLINQHLEVICLNGNIDYRATNDTSKIYSTFFIGENATINLSNLFNQLTNGNAIQQKLMVCQREILLKKTWKNIAYFEFNELCGVPLWTADYSKIAKSYDIIFIADIPDFYFYNQNEMRRFTMLIDELYENKNKLFASFSSDPILMYRIGTVPVDFKRTISRLLEMGRFSQ